MQDAAIRRPEAADLPTGTVTFLVTDIEGSTKLLRKLGDGYAAVMVEHHRLLRRCVHQQGGREIDNQGDSFFFAFERANAAVGAAVLAQRAISEHAWLEGVAVRVRMGLHTGEPYVGEQRYVGLDVHRAARIGAVAHGGQVLLSNATRELLEYDVAGVSFRDLGSYRLKDFERNERLYQLDVAGLESDFPPLRAQRVEEPRPAPQSDVHIGAEFLGYRIEEMVGQGGMGVVYRAYDLRLKRTVALKLVTPELALDEVFRERFARETEVAMSLEHPNVVPIHDAGEVAGRLYLAMRLVDGNDLRTLLRAEAPLEPSRALAICRQVAHALDAAHDRGLIHRDVKPSNVLLDADEHAYLADFGLTRRLEEQGSQTGEARSVGTPAYLAPEHLEGKVVDRRADVYSLGCVLFECLAGRPPYLAASRLAVAWAHLEEDVPSASALNPQLPDSIDPVLRKALAKEPEVRYPNCLSLTTAAEEALGLGKPMLQRRRRALVVAAAVAALVVAVVAAAFLARAKETARPPIVGANTLVRIDPASNAISDVTRVGEAPAAVAVAGASVWVYDRLGESIIEIDPHTNEVRRATAVRVAPVTLSLLTGPVLDADDRGAWLIGVDGNGEGRLMRVFASGGGRVTYPLVGQPRALAVGEGAVWVLVRRSSGDLILRIDAETGDISARTRFSDPTRVDSIDAGLGAVWVVASRTATLFRIDPRSARVNRRLDLGDRAGRAVVRFGAVWVGVSDPGVGTVVVDPRQMVFTSLGCCELGEGYDGATGYGSIWQNDRSTGTVVRWDAETKKISSTIRVTDSPPAWGGPCLTSIAAGAEAVWVIVAQPTYWGQCDG